MHTTDNWKGATMAQETTGSEATVGKDPAEVPTGPAATATTDATRDELASQLVDRLSLWSGAAGLIPVPFVDMAAVGGVQLYMLRRLSEIYGVPFSENRGKSILTSMAGAMIPGSAASTTKALPGIGTVIGGLTMPVVSAGATWVIGKVFIQHFASGGTLLDFNPPDYREFIKAQKAKVAARSRGAPSAPPSATAPAGSDTSAKSETTTTA